jgi:hypothetical protein
MLMWGDRLIDAAKYDLRRVGSSEERHRRRDRQDPERHHHLPIGITNRRDSYPSIPMFIEKGFRVLPAGWKNVDATKGFISHNRSHPSSKMLGHSVHHLGREEGSAR